MNTGDSVLQVSKVNRFKRKSSSAANKRKKRRRKSQVEEWLSEAFVFSHSYRLMSLELKTNLTNPKSILMNFLGDVFKNSFTSWEEKLWFLDISIKKHPSKSKPFFFTKPLFVALSKIDCSEMEKKKD
jgi:hypothetical protein